MSFRGWRLALITEDTTYLGHMAWMTQAGTDLKASFLWSCFHSFRKYFQGREAIRVSQLAATPMNRSNYQHKGAKSGNSQQQSNWTYRLHNQMEIMPGTGILASFPGIVRPWILEKSALAPRC